MEVIPSPDNGVIDRSLQFSHGNGGTSSWYLCPQTFLVEHGLGRRPTNRGLVSSNTMYLWTNSKGTVLLHISI
jgi:hypothetical protein